MNGDQAGLNVHAGTHFCSGTDQNTNLARVHVILALPALLGCLGFVRKDDLRFWYSPEYQSIADDGIHILCDLRFPFGQDFIRCFLVIVIILAGLPDTDVTEDQLSGFGRGAFLPQVIDVIDQCADFGHINQGWVLLGNHQGNIQRGLASIRSDEQHVVLIRPYSPALDGCCTIGEFLDVIAQFFGGRNDDLGHLAAVHFRTCECRFVIPTTHFSKATQYGGKLLDVHELAETVVHAETGTVRGHLRRRLHYREHIRPGIEVEQAFLFQCFRAEIAHERIGFTDGVGDRCGGTAHDLLAQSLQPGNFHFHIKGGLITLGLQPSNRLHSRSYGNVFVPVEFVCYEHIDTHLVEGDRVSRILFGFLDDGLELFL